MCDNLETISIFYNMKKRSFYQYTIFVIIVVIALRETFMRIMKRKKKKKMEKKFIIIFRIICESSLLNSSSGRALTPFSPEQKVHYDFSGIIIHIIYKLY